MNPDQIREIAREACAETYGKGYTDGYIRLFAMTPIKPAIDCAVERIVALAAKEKTP